MSRDWSTDPAGPLEAARTEGRQQLREFLDKAAWRERAIGESLAPWIPQVDLLNGAFGRFVANCPGDPFPDLAAFAVRAHGTFLAAFRTILSGQVPEALPQVRSCLETGLYAFRVLRHRERAMIWLGRSDSEAARRESKRLLKHVEIMEELAGEAPELHALAEKLYEDLIEYGAHPNPYAVLVGVRQPNDRETHFEYFQTEQLLFRFGFTMVTQGGILALRLLGLVAPELHRRLGIAELLEAAAQPAG